MCPGRHILPMSKKSFKRTSLALNIGELKNKIELKEESITALVKHDERTMIRFGKLTKTLTV